METNKEQIYKFIKLHSSANANQGISTQAIAEAMGMQRTNVSTALSQLVKEGRLRKTDSRPVLYRLVAPARDELGEFRSLIGYDGSLKQVLRQAEAVIRYPYKGLNALLLGKKGTGKRFLANLMYREAVKQNILKENAPFIQCDCADFPESGSQTLRELLGENGDGGALAEARGGILFLHKVHLLPAHVRQRLVRTVIQKEDSDQLPILILSCEERAYDVISSLENRVLITINIPSLTERPMDERFALIKQFLTLEAARTKRTLQMESEVLVSLLLFPCDRDIATLKELIRQACMNAYLREYVNGEKLLNLYISDFDPAVRKGFLNYRLHKDEVKEFVKPHTSYSFHGSDFEMTKVNQAKATQASAYDYLDRQIQNYSARGFNEEEIRTLLSIDLDQMLNQHRRELMREIGSREQLMRLVPKPLIALTEQFLTEAGQTLGVSYPLPVLYSLCMQLKEFLEHKPLAWKMNTEQITEMIRCNQAVYFQAMLLAEQIKNTFQVKLQIDEVAVVTLLLSAPEKAQVEKKGPVLLFAFHGQGVAKALAATIEATLHNNNVFAVDIPLEQADEVSYETLKKTVRDVDQGHGILAVFDLELVQQMLYTISLETGINIRTVFLPVMQLGMDWSRHAAITTDLALVYKMTAESLGSLSKPRKKIIVTLCTSSEGVAAQMKEYLLLHKAAPDADIIAISMSDRRLLREKLSGLMQEAVIQCIVGTYDPQLLSIPFVPAANVLAAPVERLVELLSLQKEETEQVNMEEICRFLDGQLEAVDMQKLKGLWQMLAEELKREYAVTVEVETGLFVHMACAINRLASQGTIIKNPRREEIIQGHYAEYKVLRRLLRPMEKKFRIIFSDDELANIITIIKQL